MKKTMTFFFFFAIIIFSGVQQRALSQEKFKIAVVPKSNESLFWKSTHAGVNLAAVASARAQILWRAPLSETDKAQQIALVEQCIEEGVAGIVLSPISQDALAEPVSKAMKKKIPVLIFDSALKGTPGKDFISFVGIDNKKAGSLGGAYLANMLEGKGRVVLLRHVAGQANTTEREDGFLKEIANYGGIRLVVKDRYAGGTTAEAKNASLELLNQVKGIDGVFCPNESTTMGMLLALQEVGLAGKVKFVGFDTPAPAIEALRKGEISALVAQDPARMGYLSIKAMVDYLRGEKVASTIDTGVQIITSANLESPEIQKLLAVPSVTE